MPTCCLCTEGVRGRVAVRVSFHKFFSSSVSELRGCFGHGLARGAGWRASTARLPVRLRREEGRVQPTTGHRSLHRISTIDSSARHLGGDGDGDVNVDGDGQRCVGDGGPYYAENPFNLVTVLVTKTLE